jgi:hypothetical protein
LNLEGEEESSRLETCLKEAIHAKLLLNLDSPTVRNVLLDAYINMSKDDADLRKMAADSTVPGTNQSLVNKAQRYACLRSLVR